MPGIEDKLANRGKKIHSTDEGQGLDIFFGKKKEEDSHGQEVNFVEKKASTKKLKLEEHEDYDQKGRRKSRYNLDNNETAELDSLENVSFYLTKLQIQAIKIMQHEKEINRSELARQYFDKCIPPEYIEKAKKKLIK